MTPEELVEEARTLGLAAVGITDHDAVGGIDRAMVAGKKLGVEIVPGVEMSCSTAGSDVHVLGYYVDHHDAELLEFLYLVQSKRIERAQRMVDKLVELGISVRMERVRELATGAAIGRPHVAQALVEAKAVQSVDEAFSRYIGYDGPAYFPKMQLSPREAVDFIHKHGGVAVVAHPANYHQDSVLYSAIEAGVDGVEVWHPDHQQRNVDHYRELAQKNGLLMTGGSDCHGGRKRGRVFLGMVAIPYKYLAALKRRQARLQKK